MKKFLVIALSLLSFAAVAQVEVTKSQSTTASQSGRFRLAADGTNMGQSDNAGVFAPFALKSESFLRLMPISAADTTAPGVGFIKFGTHPSTNRLGQKRNGTGQKFETFAFTSDLAPIYQALYATVTSVNTVLPDGSGAVTFNTDKVAEGATNKYYTDARVTTLGDARYPSIAALNAKADVSAIIPFSSVAAYSNLSGVTAPASGYIKFVKVNTDERYTETNSLYIVDSAGKILKIQTLKEN